MKGATYGYILGLIIAISIFAWGINQLFFKGNRASALEVNHYLQNSKIEEFEVYKWLDEGYEQYTVAWQRGSNNSAAIHWFNFFDIKTKKYYSLKTFSYLEKNQQGTHRVSDLRGVDEEILFTGYVNQDQFNNPIYGTKENPLPVWPIDLIAYNGKTVKGNERSNVVDIAQTFYVKPETNRLFISQYLSHFMPKEEFKKRFKKS